MPNLEEYQLTPTLISGPRHVREINTIYEDMETNQQDIPNLIFRDDVYATQQEVMSIVPSGVEHQFPGNSPTDGTLMYLLDSSLSTREATNFINNGNIDPRLLGTTMPTPRATPTLVPTPVPMQISTPVPMQIPTQVPTQILTLVPTLIITLVPTMVLTLVLTEGNTEPQSYHMVPITSHKKKGKQKKVAGDVGSTSATLPVGIPVRHSTRHR
ncbi:hypothetical protein CVT25_009306 [Psilocybe cyanescens]|uniref:Uncharacterized protein n=1 Tax=Psilocybe cyanescens TaxID=93625 RepID=A0A409XDM4_PSICY|nr:hypothetical protein CVT25_009306 [Psilocybe cyanescens]